MIRITDTTLTHIPSAVDFDHLKIIHFCELLCLVGAYYIEMPVSMYEHILKLFSESDSSTGAINQYSPEIIKARLNALPLVLRIELDAQMQSFPESLRFKNVLV